MCKQLKDRKDESHGLLQVSLQKSVLECRQGGREGRREGGREGGIEGGREGGRAKPRLLTTTLSRGREGAEQNHDSFTRDQIMTCMQSKTTTPSRETSKIIHEQTGQIIIIVQHQT